MNQTTAAKYTGTLTIIDARRSPIGKLPTIYVIEVRNTAGKCVATIRGTNLDAVKAIAKWDWDVEIA